MSRIGNKIINLQAGVSLTVADNNYVTVTGPKGELSFAFNPKMKFNIDGTTVTISRPTDSIEDKTIHGTTRAVLNNMTTGVVSGFQKILTIEGVGYRASLKGNVLVIAAGYSHLVELEIPKGLTVVCPTQTEVQVSGIDKQLVGQFSAEIRNVRRPEPYLGKGIRYKNEIIRRKEGKKAK